MHLLPIFNTAHQFGIKGKRLSFQHNRFNISSDNVLHIFLYSFYFTIGFSPIFILIFTNSKTQTESIS